MGGLMLDGISPLIEVAIGLVLMWFIAATVCSGVVELISSALGFRSNALWQTLGKALGADEEEPNAAVVSSAKMAKKVKPEEGGVLGHFIDNVPGVTRETTKRVRAIAAGASFWFDVLRRLTGLRKPASGGAV